MAAIVLMFQILSVFSVTKYTIVSGLNVTNSTVDAANNDDCAERLVCIQRLVEDLRNVVSRLEGTVSIIVSAFCFCINCMCTLCMY